MCLNSESWSGWVLESNDQLTTIPIPYYCFLVTQNHTVWKLESSHGSDAWIQGWQQKLSSWRRRLWRIMMNHIWSTMIQQISPNWLLTRVTGLRKTGNLREHTTLFHDLAGGEVLEGRGIRSSQQLWKCQTQLLVVKYRASCMDAALLLSCYCHYEKANASFRISCAHWLDDSFSNRPL